MNDNIDYIPSNTPNWHFSSRRNTIYGQYISRRVARVIFGFFLFLSLTATMFVVVVGLGYVWTAPYTQIICGNTLFDSIVLISIKRLWRQTKEIPLKSADLMWNLCVWLSCQWTVYDIAFQHHHYQHSIQSTLNF